MSETASVKGLGLRILILGALVSPSVVVLIDSFFSLSASGDLPARIMFSCVFAGLWLAAAVLVFPVREFAIDLGMFLIRRVPLAVLVLGAFGALFIETTLSSSLAWVCVATSLGVLCVASLVETAQTDRKLAKRLVSILAVNAVLLLAAEFVVHSFVLPRKSHNSIFIEHDAVLGWRLRPGLSVRRETSRYDAHESINRVGFRTPDVAERKPAGVRRIVVLGDSHTEAYTVNDDETYAARLQELLGGGGVVEVISLGVGGFSTDQELLAYLHYGRRYDPDLVLLQFCPNDVPFNGVDRYWRGLKPRFVRHGDAILLEGVPVPDARRFEMTELPLLRRSGILMILKEVVSRFSVFRRVEKQDAEEAWRVTDLLLRDLRRHVESDGAELVAFNSNPDEEPADRRLRELLERRSIRFIDIEPCFEGDIEGHRVREDTHWNARGHEAVARALARELAPESRPESRLRPSAALGGQ